MSDEENKVGGFFSNPTRRIGGGAAPTEKLGVDSEPTQKKDFYEDPTRALNSDQDSSPQVSRPVGQSDGERTQRVRPKSAGSNESSIHDSSSSDSKPEFVVGWLVIVEGPGKGVSKPLGYGMNSVGRGDDSMVKLNYGDEEVSRSIHCHIAYDHKNKRFYIQHGGGQNLTYLGEEPVLASCELPAGSEISIGQTTMKFIQFCGDEFDWEGQSQSG